MAGILTRPLLRPQQRLDLEDIEVLLSGMRTDSKLYTRAYMTETSSIVKGFTIAQSFIGQVTADISLQQAALFNPDNSTDFSWWVAPETTTDLTIPTGTGGLQAGRNFVEIQLGTEEGTLLQRAFWDPSAASGEGVEFTNEVNTVVDTCVSVVVNQASFSGDPDKIPVAIIDLDGSFTIQGIQDKRTLFFRLGEPNDIDNSYPFGSRVEPATNFSFTSPSATAFQDEETVTFSSGATATVQTGGNDNIAVFSFSNINYLPGDTITGSISGAVATVATYYESFSGADKDISNINEALQALMTEFKTLKGTRFWYEEGSVSTLKNLLDYINSILSPISAGAKFSWDGTQLSITDDITSGQATSDVICALRIPGLGSDLLLTRQDGTGGSAPLGISDGSVLYIEIPTAGDDRTFSESGLGDTNFKVVDRAVFEPTDKRVILAYREGGKLIIKGSGELQAGESKEVGDETTTGQLAFTGAEDETDTTPPYTTTPDPGLSNQYTTADSLTQAISINAANINDIANDLLRPYEEQITVIDGVPVDDHELATDSTDSWGRAYLAAGSTITIPLDSRNSDAQKTYRAGSGSLFMFINGQYTNYSVDYDEPGALGTLISDVTLLTDVYEDDVITFRIITPQFFGVSGLSQPFFVNQVIGQLSSQIPVGSLYNSGTNKLAVHRNGVFMHLTTTVGDPVYRYTEPNNNSVSLTTPANSSDVFTFVNYEDPNPNVILVTGFAGTVLTVPTYTQGDDSFKLYKNGVLMTTEGAAPSGFVYAETTSTSVTLSDPALASDVFAIYISGSAPQWREDQTGLTINLVTLVNNFTNGDNKLLVSKNGVLCFDSTTLGDPGYRYQQVGTNQINFEVALVADDIIQVIYV